jgi:hypothetical protein
MCAGWDDVRFGPSTIAAARGPASLLPMRATSDPSVAQI